MNDMSLDSVINDLLFPVYNYGYPGTGMPMTQEQMSESQLREGIKSLIYRTQDSEQNKLFAIMRHLGIEHDAKEIMRVRKDWDNKKGITS